MGNYLAYIKLKIKATKTYKLIKSRDTKVIFLHCPKTGGSYINQPASRESLVLSNMDNWGHATVHHSVKGRNPFYNYKGTKINPKYLEKEIGSRKVITVVRNHFDWLVSYYYHAGGDPANKYYNPYHYDSHIAAKGFEYLVKSICDRDDVWPNKNFIFRQAFSSSGIFLPDYVARTHTLDDDLCKIASLANLKYKKGQRQRVGRANHEYKDYFEKNIIDLVYSTWNKEISLYGFDYEDVENDSYIIGRGEILKEQKSAISYDGSELIIRPNSTGR